MLFFFTKLEEMSRVGSRDRHPRWRSNYEIKYFQGEEPEDTMMWFKSLQFYTQCLGGWRKRRKGLANIMIDPNIVSPSTAAAAAGISGISVSGDDPDEDNVPEGAAAVE